MAVYIHVQPSEKLYLRDPRQTDLGRKIIKNSIILIDEIGFEKFTFKKLAAKIESTEASVYRYFENKYNLMVYLMSWYWEWVHYQVDYSVNNVSDPRQRLRIAISVIVESSKDDPQTEYVNENLLHRIAVVESTKAYHTKSVDEKNREGFFLNYKSLIRRLVELIREIRPDFAYPNVLASNLVEMAYNHYYYAKHLPTLTNLKLEGDNLEPLKKLVETFAFGVLDAK
jgi:AcrR family transcriptional regulator